MPVMPPINLKKWVEEQKAAVKQAAAPAGQPPVAQVLPN